MGKKKAKSKQIQQSQQNSAPLTPKEVSGYFKELSGLTGGRLQNFAQTGTPVTPYEAPSDTQLQNVGGLGATRRNTVLGARETALQEIAANPNLTTFQQLRAKQLADAETKSELDALDKEIEAAITNLAFERAKQKYQAGSEQARLTREDLEALAAIYYGGRGQRSSGTNSGSGSSAQREGLSDFFSFGINI